MAEFTGSPTSASPHADQVNSDQGSVGSGHLVSAGLSMARFSYTHSAGAGTGEVNLVSLPPGEYVIYSDLSRIVSSQFAATADLHLGHRAFTKADGTTAAEDPIAFADNLDAGGGALDQAWPLPAGGATVISAASVVTIFALIDTGNIEDTDTIDGWVAYAKVR